MKLLITGDFQADWQNLDLCERSWVEILDICSERKIRTIILTGDLKHVYNPVDVRVTKWWQRAIERATRKYITVVCNLGNHDRIGQHKDTENWFPILKRAGAICLDQPDILLHENVAMLPYCTNKNQLRENVKVLAKRANEDTILIFHEDIKGCGYNYAGSESKNGIDRDWLCADRFRYCIGGHIHMYQKIENNIYYCGSPFSQDWGEANQRKGYVVVDNEGLEFVPTKYPGWFDPTWKGFYEPESWDGAKVRIHITCRSGHDYIQRVGGERRKAEAKYRGAEIYVTANFERGETGTGQGIQITDPDEVKIREYVRQTCPENIAPLKAIKYLLKKVNDTAGKWTRWGTGVQFVRSVGENLLSWEELDIDWEKRGIVLLQGKNGVGKTSYVQTIPIPLFGRTFKGQKHDGWARRNAKGRAAVSLELKDGRNRRIKIVRGRKPTKLRLWVDGKEQTTGMKSQEKDQTQGQIEKVTGFTWQTLANAVYIDREVANAFIAGTKRERTSLLSRFQNLERFEKALEGVRQDKAKEKEWATKLQEQFAVAEERIKGLERRISILIEESESRVEAARGVVKTHREEKDHLERSYNPKIEVLKEELGEVEDRYEQLRDKEEKLEWAAQMWEEKIKMVKKDKDNLESLKNWPICPMCKSEVSRNAVAGLLAQLEVDLTGLNATLAGIVAKRSKAIQKVMIVEGEITEQQTRIGRLVDRVKAANDSYEFYYKAYLDLKRREHLESDSKAQANKELRIAKKKQKELVESQTAHRLDMEFYEYCERALSRDGIPSFLNALLCGPLNVASEYYGELFGSGDIQIRFELENGEFVPRVVNVDGGEEIEDQSTGERALAGLIASFALREAAPKCNLLILDEPGEGLDPSRARQFAKGLRELSGKFDSIFLTTHNQAISSELQDQEVLNVVKRNGVSQIQ